MCIVKFSCDISWILINRLKGFPLYIAQKDVTFWNCPCVKWHIRNSKRHGMNGLRNRYRANLGILIIDFLVQQNICIGNLPWFFRAGLYTHQIILLQIGRIRMKRGDNKAPI